MNWLTDLFTNGESIAHILILYALVISFGVLLGKVKIGGISLGVTFVLFVGIVAGHILHINNIEEPQLVMNFIQDFGLILFVYSIGLQVGPSFFTSFKQGGIKMNAIALGIILCNIIVTLGLYYGFCDKNDPQSLPMMVGVLCGAVTNTPGLGAANAALEQIGSKALGGSIPNIANGYACAYPLGVIGIIGSIILFKYIFKIDWQKENTAFEATQGNKAAMKPHLMHLEVCNASINDKTIAQIRNYIGRNFVISRCLHEGHVSLPKSDTKLYVGDQLFVVSAQEDADAIIAFIGKTVNVNWEK